MFYKKIPVQIALSAAVMVFAGVLFSGCGVKQQIHCKKDGSGYGSVEVNLSSELQAYLKDLMLGLAGAEASENSSIFDVNAIELAFGRFEHLDLKKIETPGNGRLSLEYSFSDINSVFAKDATDNMKDIISFSTNGETKRIQVYLDNENFIHVARLAGIAGTSVYDALGPNKKHPLTEQEYTDLLIFALEEYSEGTGSIQEVIGNSNVNINFTVEGNVLNQRGGRLTEQGVLFSIPVTRVMTLAQPLELMVEFR